MAPRTRPQEARAKAAAVKAAQVRADQRRRAVLVAVTAVVVVMLVLVALVVVKVAGGGKSTPTARSATAATLAPEALRAVTTVPATTLDLIGPGPIAAGPRKIDAPAMTAGGKPRILYLGAEYCPFCAAERWPVVVALSRFGTWQLGTTRSAHDDVFPDTATLSFHRASYTSDYLSFTGVETAGNVRRAGTYPALDPLSAPDQRLVDRYNAPPYVPASAAKSIPFVLLGGRYLLSGGSYSPGLLAGKDQTAIAAALKDPTSPIAQSIDGSANLVTAAVCGLTADKPAAVCGTPGVLKAKQRLDAQK